MLDKNHTRRIAEAKAKQLLSELPTHIRIIVEHLPFGARYQPYIAYSGAVVVGQSD
ncbi:hypothetical protein HX867_15990 [Pseudomonas gingeri]|uniref:hypothetical protein n=1 Tax=Pseudomonas gingeri TaxID=117681 RepID=UPI00159F90A2|nr:hypothetical protein [Pseudomonas gingeri]NVZ63595.1 hypothetical protein [Pseudomonas gingeri]